jgi:hypothetical protein
MARKDDLSILDALARRYGCRPSAIARGAMLDFNIDLGAYMAAMEEQESQPAEANVIEW